MREVFRNVRAVLLLGVALLAGGGAPLRAAPLTSAGDAGFRRDLEILAAAGGVRGPLHAWPLDWDQVRLGIASLDRAVLPPRSRAALDRVRRRLDRETAPGWHRGARVDWTHHPALAFDFGGRARRDVDLGVSLAGHRGELGLRLAGGFRGEEGRRGRFVPDGTVASAALGPWTVYGGWPERWYGPGWDAGMVLSRDARPVPGIGFFNRVPRRSEGKVLGLVGPWRVDGFLGVLEGDRPISHPLLVHLRVAFVPFSKLELGINRGMMLCGEGRPCDPWIWLRSLVGLFDADNTGTAREPGNQVASFEARYAVNVAGLTAAPYSEVFIEDEVQDVSALFGLVLDGDRGRKGDAWRLRAEYSDTMANRILGNPDQGITYTHFIYTGGYTYRGRVIGHPLGGDSRLATLEGVLTRARGTTGWLRYRFADVNTSGNAEMRTVSVNRERIQVVEAGISLPNRYGATLGELRYLSDRPNTPGKRSPMLELEIGWRAAL